LDGRNWRGVRDWGRNGDGIDYEANGAKKMSRDLPKSGEIWAHYRGTHVEIIDIAIDGVTGDKLIIYRHGESTEIYIRRIDNFLGNAIDNWGNPIYRFELVATDTNIWERYLSEFCHQN
jgi:hypothetical protein